MARREKWFLSSHDTPSNGCGLRGSRRRSLRCELLEARHLLSGVTLITHGFNSSVDDWVTAMADAIAARPDLAVDQPRYRVEVTDPGHDGGPLSVVNTSRTGPPPADCADPEIVILLNWSDVAGTLSLGGGYHRSTVDVAAAVAAKLVSTDFLLDLATPLAELPFHLIGHSRGASLVGELAKDLGAYGVWVDQVTTLDPHPVDGVREPSWPLNFNFGDAPMTSWENVSFWDNYWRTDGSSSLDFTGETVNSTYDVQLSESVLSNGGYSYEHSDVHLWYHGTVDTAPTANDGSYTVPTSWYGGVHPVRDATGYLYSALVSGIRPSAGLAAALGGTAVRSAIDWSAAEWANLLELGVAADDLQFGGNDSIPLSYYYQDFNRTATITFSLDVDKNPYNENAVLVGQNTVGQTGSTPVVSSFSLSTSGIAAGSYYVTAEITDAGGHTRYAYAPDPVAIVNTAPSVALIDAVTTLPENVVTTPRIKIADIHLTDDGLGTNVLSLSGANSAYFEIDGNELFLKAGTLLDYETNPYMEVVVAVDDAQVGFSPDDTVALTIAVTDVNERPALDFGGYTIEPYDATQDSPGGSFVGGDGTTLQITGNHWKKIAFPYTVTTDTVLEFDFQSSTQGEIQGIGVDTDNAISAESVFQLYGTQTWGLQNYRTYASSASNVQHYVIPVGKFFTGEMTYLVFTNDDDLATVAESVFSNVKVYEMTLTVEVQGSSEMLGIGSFISQDLLTQSLYVGDDSQALRFVGNAWKQLALNYTVTAATVLEFDFQSSAQGEIQGVGFDNDTVLSPEWFFQIYGTQTLGLQTFRDYAESAGSVKHYAIPVGRFFQGPMSYLVFAADDDASAAAEGIFSNVRLYEPELKVEVQGVARSLLVTGFADQDQAGRVPSLRDGFQTLELDGNSWKKVALGNGTSSYTVTENTILEFDFASGVEGEIQGIGLDSDEVASADWFFELSGTQRWGHQVVPEYSGSGVAHYVIPVGTYFTGTMSYLVFANDDDAQAAAESVFSNVALYEGGKEALAAGARVELSGAGGSGQATTTLSGDGSVDLGYALPRDQSSLSSVDPLLLDGLLSRAAPAEIGRLGSLDMFDPWETATMSGRLANRYELDERVVVGSIVEDALCGQLAGTKGEQKASDRALLELFGWHFQRRQEDGPWPDLRNKERERLMDRPSTDEVQTD